MPEDQPHSQEPPSLLGTLLAPLRAPQRVVTDIETIASALLSLQHDAAERLASIDERAGGLLSSIGALRAPLDRIDRKVTELTKLEAAITDRMDKLHDDLDARLRAAEQEVRALRPPIEQMARDVAGIMELLPDPSDGPMARLKDTFSPS
ncbi:MAG: hypothetical protein H0T43_09910 [Solirubrobacterales bacterium]|nr:hypothetical protein [Solirubrobacterales bacterium]